jgi:hypothetical protein
MAVFGRSSGNPGGTKPSAYFAKSDDLIFCNFFQKISKISKMKILNFRKFAKISQFSTRVKKFHGVSKMSKM